MIAIQPPAYFPGLHYMALVHHVDCFVLADTFPYRRRHFASRSKLRNPQGWQWITVPLRAHQRGRPISAVAINTDDPWQGKHWRAFQYNYRSTPYFEYFEPQIEPFFEREWDTLGALTCASVTLLHDRMEGSTQLLRASALEGAPDTVPAILDAVDAAPLVTVPTEDPRDAQMTHADEVLRFDPPTYHQNFEGFEPGMSAADLLFNYGPEARTMLAQHAQGASAAEAASSDT